MLILLIVSTPECHNKRANWKKTMLSLKAAYLGPIDYIKCPKTKEIILNNKIQPFFRELKVEFFKKKIRSKDWKLTEIIEKK